ncbi:MAG: hypothetical protein WCR42_12180 [bacterium]
MIKFGLLIIALLIVSTITKAQVSEILFDNIFETLSKESNLSIDVESIEFYKQNPINLATASPKDILQLSSFTYHDALRISEYISKHRLLSIGIISDSLNLTTEQELILGACTYIHFNQTDDTKKPTLFYRARNQTYLSDVYGIKENKFQGSSLNLYQRIIFENNSVSAGIVADKDCGERSLADFLSAYASYKQKNYSIIVGDYYLGFGLGNLFWRPMGGRKGADVISPALEMGTGIKPYRSTIENNYFRGVAGDYKFRINDKFGIKTSLWFSSINRSSNIDSAKKIVTSIYTAGYYRTGTEIAKKYNLNEISYGADAQLVSNDLIIGFTAVNINYAYDISSSSSSAFSGKSGALLSAYALYNTANQTIAVELSKDAKDNIALKSSLQGFSKNFDYAFHFRYFPEFYRSPYGTNFGEFSYPANETGLYSAFNWKISQVLVERFYLDLYKSNGPTYYVPSIVRGIDMFSESEFKVNADNKLIFRLHGEAKTDAVRIPDSEDYIFFTGKDFSVRGDWIKEFNGNFNFRLRLEGCKIFYEDTKPDELGWGSFLEFNWIPSLFLKISPRIAYFSTDSYSSAVWFFEYALPGLMSTQALYGKGIRGLINVKVSPLRNLNINIRYSITYKPEEVSLGSSYLEILDNKDQRVYLQLDYSY